MVQKHGINLFKTSTFQDAHVQVHLKKKIEYGEKLFSCNLFQKVKLLYILDSSHVK